MSGEWRMSGKEAVRLVEAGGCQISGAGGVNLNDVKKGWSSLIIPAPRLHQN
jgi:hypothetical protein